MNDRIFVLFFLLLWLCVVSCNPGVYDEKLADGCFYLEYNRPTNEITCPFIKGKGIYGEIVGHDFDSDFIIAAQRPDAQAHIQLLSMDLFSDTKSHSRQESDECDKKADSTVRHDLYFQKILSAPTNYWIVGIKQKKLYGPLNEEGFIIKRLELGVSSKLKLKQ